MKKLIELDLILKMKFVLIKLLRRPCTKTCNQQAKLRPNSKSSRLNHPHLQTLVPSPPTKRLGLAQYLLNPKAMQSSSHPIPTCLSTQVTQIHIKSQFRLKLLPKPNPAQHTHNSLKTTKPKI